jgi:hypothetical protein
MIDLRTRIAAVLWNTGWGVHNHGSEQGDGLACRERLVDGQLRGDCYWKQADAVIRELDGVLVDWGLWLSKEITGR